MRIKLLPLLIVLGIFSSTIIISCTENGGGRNVVIPDFNFATSITFAPNLSEYNIFQGNPQDLKPNEDYHLMELSSPLFTDYSKKQRLVKLPSGTQMTRSIDNSLNFPDSTILVKTFYYYNDERDMSLGKRVIETRLLIKENDLWNIATYVWNDQQTDATLSLNGLDTQVDWISESGTPRTTLYHVPDENECISCHQTNLTTIPLGTRLRNLNRDVTRNNINLNQIGYLQSVGIINSFDISQISKIVDYNDITETLVDRARAYMDINCAHCHNPDAWEESASQELDFRYETALNATGIIQESDKIQNLVSNGEMPFIGTTILDDDGVQLIVDYIGSL